MKLLKTTIITPLIFLILATAYIQPIQAANLEFIKIEIANLENDKLTIRWITNQPAQGWLQVGQEPGKYLWTIAGNEFNTSQEATIVLPKENTTYHYRIIAENTDQQRITSLAQSYKVKKFTDNKLPQFLSIPKILYVDNHNAFLLWQTNEQTTAKIKFSQQPDLSQSRSTTASTDKNKNYQARVHLKKLQTNTTYYYEVTITDKSKNSTKTAILNFTTRSQADLEPLRLLNQKPLANEDANITDSSIKATWQTSRPANCSFLYGEKNKSKKKLTVNEFENRDHQYLAENLKPNTEYQYQIICYDIFGKKLDTGNINFRTRLPVVLGYEYQTGGQENFYGQKYQLVKTPTSPNIYILVNKQKYLVKSPSVFNAYGFRWSEIKMISQKELDRYPTATLVKTPESPAVYFLYHGLKRKKVLLTETAFRSYRHNSFSKVITVSPQDLQQYPDIVLVKEPNKSTVYLLQGASKRPIKNMEALYKNNLAYQPIGLVSTKDLSSYQTGDLLE